MNLATNHVFAPDEEVKLLRNIDQAKFKNYAKERFGNYVKFTLEPSDFQKNANQQIALRLPKEINELFINLNFAQYFWFIDSPLLFRTESYLKNNPGKFLLFNSYWDVKKYYKKWVKLKNQKDKSYFALSVHKILSRNLENFDFLSLIFYSVILAYDKNISSIDDAINILKKVQNDILTLEMNGGLKNELLYTVTIFTGFYNLLKDNNQDAIKIFEEAKNYKVNPVTAVFYQALAYQKLNYSKDLFGNLRQILDYDKLRFQYSLDICSERHFNYFFSNAVFYQLLSEPGFSSSLDDIKLLIESSLQENRKLISTIYERVIEIDDQNDEEECSPELLREINFMKNLLGKYHKSKNLLFISLAPVIKNKFNLLIHNIENYYGNYYSNRINESINGYDNQINQTEKKLQQIEAEKRNIEIKTNEKLRELIEGVEKFYNEQLQLIENRIKTLPAEGKYNPANVFKDIMIFSTLIAIMIFVIGGFASGITDNPAVGDATNGIIHTIFSAGLKWGGITFLIGIFIAMFSAASAVMDKSSFHQKLVKEISRLKALKEEEIKRIKSDMEHKKQTALKTFEKKEALFKDDLEKFTAEKKEELEKLQIEAQIEIEEKLGNIKKLYIN